jgi:hypothetical protein
MTPLKLQWITKTYVSSELDTANRPEAGDEMGAHFNPSLSSNPLANAWVATEIVGSMPTPELQSYSSIPREAVKGLQQSRQVFCYTGSKS